MDRGYRQTIVDEYLNSTRANRLVPADFLSWLKKRPKHRAYGLFFGATDAEAAHEHRLAKVRNFVNGLRITVSVSTYPSEAKSAKVMVTIPTFISPASSRRGGGGYVQTDMEDPEMRREMARQVAADLRRVVERHQGIATVLVIDISAISQAADAFAVIGGVKE